MGGIYGDMLTAWPEQQRKITVYGMTPRINGGWDTVKDKDGNVITQNVIGIFQNTRGKSIKDSNGNQAMTEGCEFWTHEGSLEGKFFQWANKVYRLNTPDGNDWSFEGGFHRYGVEKVIGNNGTESDNTTWNLGGNSFG